MSGGRGRASGWPLWPLIIAGLAAAAAWNATPFREREMHVRAKDLSFLPSPALGRVLSLGQCAAASKLRWIDSFSYFELQLDRRDDRIAGTGESGFQRLYDLLIALDPGWETFYQHAAFNTGALVGRHDLALGYLLRGLIELPHDTQLWRQTAAELCVQYRWEETQPAAMEAFLDQWAAAELTENDKRLVWDWKSAMARRRHRGVEQLAYWQDQLASARPGSPSSIFVELTIREQLARFCLDELNALAALFRAGHGFAPITAGDVLDPDLLLSRYQHGPPLHGPVIMRMGVPALRDDPYGFPFVLADGVFSSPGFERFKADRRRLMGSPSLAEIATHFGRWPKTLEDARTMGLELFPLPPGGTYRLSEHEVVIDWDPPPGKPWPLREMLASAQP